jgi:hypothetical protein
MHISAQAIKPPAVGHRPRPIGDARFIAMVARIRKPHAGKRALYRLLLVLALVPAAFVFIFGLPRGPVADSKPRPLDFPSIQQRISQVQSGQTYKEIVQLFGPPTERFVDDPELAEAAIRFNNFGKEFMPAEGAWDRWVDPHSPNRWVAILYDRDTDAGTVYYTYKKGF